MTKPLLVAISCSLVHLGCSSGEAASADVPEDSGAVTVERPTLYTLFDGTEYREHRLDFTVDQPGLSLFSATFG